MPKLPINVDENFPHLTHAPIVEAVIDIRTRAAVELTENGLRGELEFRLGGYTFLDSLQDLRIQHQIGLTDADAGDSTSRELVWRGLRFQSGDKRHIVQFKRNGFVFSRLEPYEGWEQFSQEGMRLWSVYRQLAQPADLYRIGLRFINRVHLPSGDRNFEHYIRSFPTPPAGLDLPLLAFLHQDTFAVPDYPYAVNVVTTIQSPDTGAGQEPSLILDIDVLTVPEAKLDEENLILHLRQMRWLKNHVFFGSVTQQAISLFH